MNDLINRQDAIDALKICDNNEDGINCHKCPLRDERWDGAWEDNETNCYTKLMRDSAKLLELPSAQPEKEIPRRVLWSGWKGTRYTRYKCPNCNKPVKNDDVYCHRCGQKLMFPHISHTPYIEGQKQELIVRWDDEE